MLTDKYDPGDIEFLDEDERRRVLGLDDDESPDVDDEEMSPLAFNEPGPVVPAQVTVRQPPSPGWLEIRLAAVARSRGVLNARGNFKGHVSVTGLARGTNLAPSTIMPLLRNDPDIRLIHVDTISRLCEYLKCTPGDLIRYHSGIRPKFIDRANGEDNRQ